ncbi:Hypothetical predicted protein [Cloeon dipterum]|uniref:Uncharacterized protein n=1 Tax=Cloeon dipterum TaxID=197152 RepID=A0A8S1E1J8_9INSE|nr:Hypothetical predicted protein [Cloeon dipterum]
MTVSFSNCVTDTARNVANECPKLLWVVTASRGRRPSVCVSSGDHPATPSDDRYTHTHIEVPSLSRQPEGPHARQQASQPARLTRS